MYILFFVETLRLNKKYKSLLNRLDHLQRGRHHVCIMSLNRINVDYWFKQFGSRSVQLDGSNIFGSNARHIEEIDIYVYVSKHMTSW